MWNGFVVEAVRAAGIYLLVLMSCCRDFARYGSRGSPSRYGFW